MGRDLGRLVLSVLFFVVLHIPALVLSVPVLLLGYQVRRPKQENEDRPVERAEVGAFDDDDDPNRRRHKWDFRDHENIRRMSEAMQADPCEPTVPVEVWHQTRRLARQGR